VTVFEPIWSKYTTMVGIDDNKNGEYDCEV